MKFRNTVLLLTSLWTWANASAFQADPKGNKTYIPDAYIVQLDSQAQNALLTPTNILTQVAGDIGYQVRREFTNSKYFYGLSLTVNSGTTLSDLQQIKGVQNVWKLGIVSRPAPVQTLTSSSTSPNGHSNNVTIPHITGTSAVNTPLAMAEVDKLHTMGIKGRGVKLAIIDSGVDYLHPSLGGGFGPGYKISFGYDFVGDDYTGFNDPVPGPDPLTTCASGGHGTHVTGIIGMSDPPNQGFGLVGVAPEAAIGMYRVFGCEGDASDDVIMSAMQQAAEDGADLISLSIGELSYWESASPYVSFVENLVQSGVAVVAAAGNDGQLGPYSTSAPALSPDALSVGAVESVALTTVYTAQNSLRKSLDYVSVLPIIEDTPISVYQLGSGLGTPVNSTVADGCYIAAWPPAISAITDPEHTAILILLDGFCPIAAYEQYLLQIGATRLVFFTDDPSAPIIMPEPGSTGNYTYIFLNYQASQQITKEFSTLRQGQNYTLSFHDREVHDVVNTAGGAIDYFSTMGPTVEMTQKPQLSAPGGNILSTWPTIAGGYAVLSGTSMATPFVAGVYALLKSQRPNLSIAELTAILQSTSVPLKAWGSSILSSTAQQGGGLINAYNAINSDLAISPSQLSFRDGTSPEPQTITVTNTGKNSQTYTVSHEGAAYISLFNDFTGGTGSSLLTFELVNQAEYASAKFSHTSFTLRPGQTLSMQIQVTPPSDVLAHSQPTYSGFVKIQSSETSFVVPYIGVPYDRYSAQYLDLDTVQAIGYPTPSVTFGLNYSPEINIANYTFYYLNGTAPPNVAFPNIYWTILQPSNFMRLELVPANSTFEPTYYGFDRNISIDIEQPNVSVTPGFLDVPSYGILAEWGIGEVPVQINDNIIPSPQPYNVGGYGIAYPYIFSENATLVYLTSGDYRPLLRVLRYSGNGTDPADYESWLGPVIRANI